MAKITLSDVSNILGNPTSAANTINANNDLIEQALDLLVSRDGESPNQMTADVDLNHNDIINVDNIHADVLVLNGQTIIPGDVANLPVASQEEAVAGVNNQKVMTPLRTKQAVDEYGLLQEDMPTSVRNLENLAAAASQTSKDIFIPSGSWSVTSNITFPKGLKVTIERGAQITISAGAKLNFQCLVDIPVTRVFYGDGTVVGLRDARPEWWGAQPSHNSVAGPDCSAAINAAIACVQSPETSTADGGSFPFVTLSTGLYPIDSIVVLTPTNGSPIGLRGCGTMLGTSGGSRICSRMATGVAVHVQGLYGPLDNNRLGLFVLQDFVIQDNFGPTNTTLGLMIGSETATLLDSAPTNNRISRVSIYGFQSNWRIVNARNIVFDDCSGQTPDRADAVSLEFRVSSGGGFCGECVIMGANSVFQTSPGMGFPLKFSVDDPGVNAELRGVKFMTGTFYGGQKKVGMYTRSSNAANRSYIGHIWFSSGVQLDAGGTFSSVGVEMLATGASAIIEEVTFEKTYMAGIIDHVIYGQVLSNATGFGNIVAIHLDGCKFNYIINRIATFEGGQGINIHDCWLYDCGTSTGGGPTTVLEWFQFNQVTRLSVKDNIRVVPLPDTAIWDGGTINTGVRILGGASNYYKVKDNIFLVTTPATDPGTASNRDVTGNW